MLHKVLDLAGLNSICLQQTRASRSELISLPVKSHASFDGTTLDGNNELDGTYKLESIGG